MDLRTGNNFELIFNNDTVLVDGIEEQKQKLFIFLKTFTGCLSYVPNWGLDYYLLLKLLKINNLQAVKKKTKIIHIFKNFHGLSKLCP
ncbi:hypothetical protein [Borreliella turdi]|uniref:hypothetical protein n=1 Tax=Borreliella turdi TaxID=57863 RepID=UPI001656B4B7